jgi:hypothetical protein
MEPELEPDHVPVLEDFCVINKMGLISNEIIREARRVQN